MRYGLRHNLSYCMIDGHAIFLDIEKDRYFRLEKSLEDAFLGYVHTGGGHQRYRDALIDHGILIPGPTADRCAPQQLAPPSRSLVELRVQPKRPETAAVLEVFAIVWRVRRQFRTRPLKETIEALTRYREGRRLNMGPTDPVDAGILASASLFIRSRLYVPIETSCLLDSFALARYLAGRGMSAKIVFGVTDDPFSAHCWVQTGNMVLNDTVGNALAHTPIRVI